MKQVYLPLESFYQNPSSKSSPTYPKGDKSISNALKALIDELWKVRLQISLLQTTEEKLTEKVKTKMEELDIKEMSGKFGRALLINKPRRSLSAETFLEAVEWDLEKLYKVASVRVEGNKKKELKGASDFLSKEDIERICKTTPKISLIVQSLVPKPTQTGVQFTTTV